MSLLVVDDDEGARRYCCRLASSMGWTARAAGSAAEALADALHAPPDGVLTDVNMPGMGGLELARELRRAFPGLRIAFMTGGLPRDQDEAERLRSLGPVFIKPVGRAQLEQAFS